MGDRNGHFHKILIGYDGSSGAEKAVELGFALARIMDSALSVLAVTPPAEPSNSALTEMIMNRARERYEQALQRIANSACENAIAVETRVVIGSPTDQIIASAVEGHADLIIVGRRGTSTFEQLMMGAVSERVLRLAPCAVLIAT
jgi:nucleotide-binding universal stress UspA family protein